MTWEIVSGLIVIATFLIAFAKYCGGLTRTLQKLGDSFDALSLTFKEFKQDIKSDLKDVKNKVDDHENRLNRNQIL